MAYSDETEARTDGAPDEQLDPTLPKPKKPGYDRQKFMDAWGANAGHTPDDLKGFIASNPDFATGVEMQGGSKDKIKTPTYMEDGTGISRGPEYLDLIQDAGPGGANKWGWGPSGGGGGAPTSSVPFTGSPGAMGFPSAGNLSGDHLETGVPGLRDTLYSFGVPDAQTRVQAGSMPSASYPQQPATQTPAQGAPGPTTQTGIPTDSSPLSQFLTSQLLNPGEGQTANRSALGSTLKSQADEYAKPVTADDPIIAAQVDAYGGNLDRALKLNQEKMAQRAHAEGTTTGGFDAALSNATMQAGRDKGGFQASLMSTELNNRRQALSDMLQQSRGVMSDQDQADIQQKIATIDGIIRSQGVNLQDKSITGGLNTANRGLDLTDKMGSGGMALTGKSLDQSGQVSNRGLDLQGEGLDLTKLLGLSGLDLQDKLGTANVGIANKGLDIGDSNTRAGLNLQDKLGTGNLDLSKLLGLGRLDLDKLLGLGGLSNQAAGINNQATGINNQNNQFYDQFAYNSGKDANNLDSELLKILLG